jgi:hypothetical protein
MTRIIDHALTALVSAVLAILAVLVAAVPCRRYTVSGGTA